MMTSQNWRRWGAIASTGALLASCVTTRMQSDSPHVSVDPPRGHVAADEPRAAQTGRDILRDGGSAADAAVAMTLMMSATLPSRVGLAGGGVCLSYNAEKQTVQTLDFLPRTAAAAGAPATLRAMAMLHARAGQLRWGKVVAAAEQEALRGVEISRSLRNDVKTAGGAPFALPGDDGLWVQSDLGATLSRARSGGAGTFYAAGAVVGAAVAPGAGTAAAGIAPQWRDSIRIDAADGGQLHFAALPDGPSAAALQAAWTAGIKAAPDQRAAAAAVLTRQSDGAPAAVPAAGVVAMDRYENVVACSLTMGGLFGGGKAAPGTGLLTAKAVNGMAAGTPVLFANPFLNRAIFAAAAGGQGGDGPLAGPLAALGAALPAVQDDAKAVEILTTRPAAAPGRVALVTCQSSKDNMFKKCQAAGDPRAPGMGFSVDNNQREN